MRVTRGLRAEDVVGFDISDGMLREARARQPAGLFVQHDFHEPVPAQYGQFDVVLAVSALEFCRDLPLLCRNVAAALVPGGRALLTPVHPSRGRPRLEPTPFAGLVIRSYDRREARAALDRAGLVVKSERLGRGWNSKQRTYWYRFWTVAKPMERSAARPPAATPP